MTSASLATAIAGERSYSFLIRLLLCSAEEAAAMAQLRSETVMDEVRVSLLCMQTELYLVPLGEDTRHACHAAEFLVPAWVHVTTD